jgi:hypothetical protein
MSSENTILNNAVSESAMLLTTAILAQIKPKHTTGQSDEMGLEIEAELKRFATEIIRRAVELKSQVNQLI